TCRTAARAGSSTPSASTEAPGNDNATLMRGVVAMGSRAAAPCRWSTSWLCATAAEEQCALAPLDAELAHARAVDQGVLVHQVHPVVEVDDVAAVVDRQVEVIAPAQGVARHLADGLADHVVSGADPASGAVRCQRPDPALAAAVAVQEALVENQPFALAAAVDLHVKAFDHVARAILKHAPGLHR